MCQSRVRYGDIFVQAVIACMLEQPATPPARKTPTAAPAAPAPSPPRHSPSETPPSERTPLPGMRRPPQSPGLLQSSRARAADSAVDTRRVLAGSWDMSFNAESSVAADAGSVRSSVPSEAGDIEVHPLHCLSVSCKRATLSIDCFPLQTREALISRTALSPQ